MTHRAASRRRRFPLACLAALTLFATSTSPAHAASDDEEALPDARLMGYETPVNIAGGTMGSYVLAAFVGVLTVGVTFKNARRSHLD